MPDVRDFATEVNNWDDPETFPATNSTSRWWRHRTSSHQVLELSYMMAWNRSTGDTISGTLTSNASSALYTIDNSTAASISYWCRPLPRSNLMSIVPPCFVEFLWSTTSKSKVDNLLCERINGNAPETEFHNSEYKTEGHIPACILNSNTIVAGLYVT